jgi:hypothetical protein
MAIGWPRKKHETQGPGDVAQVVEGLSSRHEALSSKPQYYQKKKKGSFT